MLFGPFFNCGIDSAAGKRERLLFLVEKIITFIFALGSGKIETPRMPRAARFNRPWPEAKEETGNLSKDL